MSANQGEVLREAGERLRIMATQKLASEMSEEDRENADWQGGYEWFCHEARWLRQTIRSALTALSQASESQSQPAMDEVALRNAFLEGLRSGWNSGRAGETMDNEYAERSWQASDARATLSPVEHWNSADMRLPDGRECIGRVDMAIEVDKQRLTRPA